MPQMAPLMWTSLFTLFLTLLFLSSAKISFTKMFSKVSPLVVSAMNNNSTNKFNWKW